LKATTTLTHMTPFNHYKL